VSCRHLAMANRAECSGPDEMRKSSFPAGSRRPACERVQWVVLLGRPASRGDDVPHLAQGTARPTPNSIDMIGFTRVELNGRTFHSGVTPVSMI
jgi:hypothetical protein